MKLVFLYPYMKRQSTYAEFHSCTVHLDTIESFIYPTYAQLECSKRMLKFTLKFT